ncbi:MAG TPA: glutathione S-transferase [Ferrovibrio sp.]|uniref:glutathione S-transferase family protein n=1 Tax=Ferrovibrio sp. TaxID=1917215 RepID=UPI002ED441D4
MTKPAQPIKLYRFALSGHAHRAELFLSLLGLPFERINIDLAKGEQKTPAFLAKNPFGQVPVIEDGDVAIADSNAILVYLAQRYDHAGTWLPRDPVGAAHVQRWLSVAAGQLAFGPALARVIRLFKRPMDAKMCMAITGQLFAVMEATLARQEFLVGAAPTIADVALYSYTAHAPEGGIALEPYQNIRAWLARIEALPGFVPMQRSPVPEAA